MECSIYGAAKGTVVMESRIKGLLQFSVIVLVTTAGCGQPTQDPTLPATLTITISSPAFKAGEAIPKQFTGDDKNISPALQWSGVPAQAKELVLIVDDPDAPIAEPFVHWVLYGLPVSQT